MSNVDPVKQNQPTEPLQPGLDPSKTGKPESDPKQNFPKKEPQKGQLPPQKH